jgi:putative transposase
VTATAERLDQLLHRPLGEQRWLVVFLDGFGMGEHLLVGALGVAADGTKVPLGWSKAPPRTPRSAPG